MRSVWVGLLAAAVALPALPVLPAQGQGGGACGDVQLIFMNPDLQRREDGAAHASGTFFIQFQAIGANASRVAKIAFSFGASLPDGAATCDAPPPLEPATGVYVSNYRSDADPRDGFFVPINSTVVPDGSYGAAITAYDADGIPLARAWSTAVVENGPSCGPPTHVCEDHTQPWPMILPGDGEQLHAVGGITIEFGEPVADVLVRVNGQQAVPEPWTPPARDNDAKPDNDHEDCSALQGLTDPTPAGNNFVCHRTVWGSGFHLARTPEPGDVIEVTALDLSGNEATKVVTVGGATQGGAIELTVPELTLTAARVDQETDAGEPAAFELTLTNVGQGEAEARMTLQAPDNVTGAWTSPTVLVPPGEERVVGLEVTPARDVKPGTYTLTARATYKSGAEDAVKQLPLTLRISAYRPVPESPLRLARANATEAAALEEPVRQAPGLEALAAVGALALVAERAGRRR